jgi:L-serine dehydratase
VDFTNAKELLELCEKYGKSISSVMLDREAQLFGLDRNAAMEKMAESYRIMKNAINTALNDPKPTMGGLIGGEAVKLRTLSAQGKSVCGGTVAKAVAYAMGVMEVNACMGLVVAAPTAGSSGVIPGTFMAVQEDQAFSDEQMVTALFNAAAVGYIITKNASVAGAEAGCQAEVGSSSAMAASAIAELMGASPKQCLVAAGTALVNLEGLVCDPVRGEVEEPCQKRNAIGAANALTSAEIALAGIGFILPFDEMVDVMLKIGKTMPVELRETAKGGIATAPSSVKKH